MADESLEKLYQEILEQVLIDNLKLPSLPEVTMKVRAAIGDGNTTAATLNEIIAKDPALTAFLVQKASSPIYRREIPPRSLPEVISLLGFSVIDSLVMLHSAQNLIELKDATAKKLFKLTWERLIVKASIGAFLAQKLRTINFDQVQMAMLLTEVGTLTLLSAMMEASGTIDTQTYFGMCRVYSKKLGCAVLKKWEVDQPIIDMLEKSGQWEETIGEDLGLLDIANLAIYHTVRMTVDNPRLPNLDTLAAFHKLPEDMQSISEEHWLDVVADNRDEILTIISSFS